MVVSAPPELFDKRGTVYVETVASGAYGTVVKTSLKCALLSIPGLGNSDSPMRTELLAKRRMLWEPEYVMPDDAQVAIDGVAWQPDEGTHDAVRMPTGEFDAAGVPITVVLYRVCDVTRQSRTIVGGE